MTSQTAVRQDVRLTPTAPSRPDIAYQPFVELRTGALAGAEALARFGPLETAACVRLIERLGRTVELDVAMVHGVLDALDDDPGWIAVHVNVSARSVAVPGFVRDLHRELLARPAAASRLVLEVTETAPLPGRRDVLRFAHAVRDAGARLAVDDVPVGHDRHVAMGLLQPDIVKLDGPTLRRALHDGGERTRVAAIVSIARDMGSVLIAEGIEEPAHVEAALRIGAEIGQGFRLGRPLRAPLADVRAYQTA